jgi:hypothetical protein
MPNVLSTITPSPISIHSGDSTKLAISYEATQLGNVEFRCSAPFSISPASASLAPDPDGRASVTVTIRRTDAHNAPLRCDVLATFFASSLHFFVEIR